jgi:hypothetical protein
MKSRDASRTVYDQRCEAGHGRHLEGGVAKSLLDTRLVPVE